MRRRRCVPLLCVLSAHDLLSDSCSRESCGVMRQAKLLFLAVVACVLAANADGAVIHNSKFEDPRLGSATGSSGGGGEKQTNSKFEHPARHEQEEPHNSKFKDPVKEAPVEAVVTNDKFEAPTPGGDTELLRLELGVDPEDKFTNSKFKNPAGDEDDRIINSKFEHPLLLSDDIYKKKPAATKITNSKFKNPEEDNKKVKTKSQNKKSTATAATAAANTPFVFLIPEGGSVGGGGAAGLRSGVFAFMNHGVLRPLFAVGEAMGDSLSLGLAQLQEYQAQPVNPLPFGAKNKGILKFFGSFTDKDYPYAY